MFSSISFCLMFFALIYWSAQSPAKYLGIWFLAVLGLQQRMVLRPFIPSFLLLVVLLILIDRYRQARSNAKRYQSAFLIVVTQYLWIQSHQLYVVGLFIIAGFILSCFVSRLNLPFVDKGDAKLRVWPISFSLILSVLLIAATPLGLSAYSGVPKLFQGLDYLRGHVHELIPLVELPYALSLVLISIILLLFSYYKRKDVELFDLGVLAIFLAMALIAWRGVAYFVPIACVISIKNLAKANYSLSSPKFRLLQTAIIGAVLVLVLFVRWLPTALPLVGQQAGIGKAEGQWPEQNDCVFSKLSS